MGIVFFRSESSRLTECWCVCVCVVCVCVCVCIVCVRVCVCVCVCVCVQFKWAWHEAQRMIQKDEKILDEHHARCTLCVASARERENLCG
jgi:hypothetical protein